MRAVAPTPATFEPPGRTDPLPPSPLPSITLLSSSATSTASAMLSYGGRFSVRQYVPRSGATGERFSDPSKDSSVVARGAGAAVPKAPVGVPSLVTGNPRLAVAAAEEAALAAAATAAGGHAQTAIARARRERLLLELSRMDKWREMLASWDRGGAVEAPPSSAHHSAAGGGAATASPKQQQRPAKVKDRCRKGIPDAVRGEAWPALAGVAAHRAMAPRLYDDLLDAFDAQHATGVLTGAATVRTLSQVITANITTTTTSASESGGGSIYNAEALTATAAVAASRRVLSAERAAAVAGVHHVIVANSAAVAVPADVVDTIERDINRTFPYMPLFAEVGSIGQTAMFRVLIAYAQSDPAVGYCQGMSFLTALFLAYMREEDAFWMLTVLMKYPPLLLRDVFSPGMARVPLVEHVIQGLLNTRLPRLAEKLAAEGVHPSMYAAQWILTLFTYSFPFPIVTRVWDSLLCEGWKVVYRVALAALKTVEPKLLAAPGFEEVMVTFKKLPSLLDADTLMVTAFALRISRTDVAALEREYEILRAAGAPTCGTDAGSLKALHSPPAPRPTGPKRGGAAATVAPASSTAASGAAATVAPSAAAISKATSASVLTPAAATTSPSVLALSASASADDSAVERAAKVASWDGSVNRAAAAKSAAAAASGAAHLTQTPKGHATPAAAAAAAAAVGKPAPSASSSFVAANTTASSSASPSVQQPASSSSMAVQQPGRGQARSLSADGALLSLSIGGAARPS